VSSPVAGVALVHHMEMDSGVMKMRPDPSLNIPAGQTIELDPTGYHVMLMELTQELKQGSSVPITLTFKDGKGATQTVTVQAVVRPLNGNMKGM
jgi:copper(I)-binding protein